MSGLINPLDEHDRRLLTQVHPTGWRNPAPAAVYDLAVVGGGTAGLVAASGAAGLGARVALIERSLLGGDCLNTGCVPSKALLRSARVVEEAEHGARLGVRGTTSVDFAAVMTRMRARRADLAHADSVARMTSLGIDVFLGDARFTGPRSLAVDETPLRFRRAVIATGGRPAMPAIPGLDATEVLTSETLWRLTDLPRELLILGAGPIGCEMAHAFSLLGSHVTLVDSAAQVLPREDADAGALVAARLSSRGVQLHLRASLDSVTRDGGRLIVSLAGRPVATDAILVAAGRVVNVEGLGLEAAGVSCDARGVAVSDRLQTSNQRIYAAGDVCSRFQFTHAADATARLVVQNALFHGRRRASALIIPWCTFTSPEVGHVGFNSSDAAAAGAATITVPTDEIDRAVIDEAGDGFVRVHHRRGRILGATIAAPHAAELIGCVAELMRRHGSLTELSAAILPYPTMSLGLRRCGDLYRRQALTPSVVRLLKYYFRISR
jgi:pyruvate/2-oxoglutarate dehydrogenase complex dihydrolipoamide dehydrogenase (E3) component